MSEAVAAPSLLQQVRKQPRLLVDIPRELATVAPGWAYYLATGRTPFRAYSSMRKLYYLTDGLFNDAVHEVVRRIRPPAQLDRTTGVLGDMQGSRLQRLLETIERDGFYVFDERLPDADVDEIRAFAMRTPCIPRGEGESTEPTVLDETKRQAPTLDFKGSDLITCAPLRRLMIDRSLLAVTQAYLRSSVVLEFPRMWWSTPGRGQASSAAAQLFHVDLDRLRWLNFSFLMTDVDSRNGPHVFVRGSHHQKPDALRRDGRHSDEEIAKHYPGQIIEIGGRRGTIFVTDNRAFHKGKVLERGTRLIYQMVLANSLFGQTYEKVAVPRDVEPEFLETIARHPFTYSNFRV